MKFEIGKKYNGYTVVSRTEKSVKLEDELGCIKTRKIEINEKGVETCKSGKKEYIEADCNEVKEEKVVNVEWVEETVETKVTEESVIETETTTLVEDKNEIRVETKKVTLRRRTVAEEELIGYLPKRDQSKIESIEKTDPEETSGCRYIIYFKENYMVNNEHNAWPCINWKEVVEKAKLAELIG